MPFERQLLDQITAEGPHDDRVLSTMTFGFKVHGVLWM